MSIIVLYVPQNTESAPRIGVFSSVKNRKNLNKFFKIPFSINYGTHEGKSLKYSLPFIATKFRSVPYLAGNALTIFIVALCCAIITSLKCKRAGCAYLFAIDVH